MHELIAILDDAADTETAQILARYFQVRPGGYGEGDVFIGIKLSRLRSLAKPYYRVTFRADDWLPLLTSPVHEHRLACLVVMSERALRLGRTPEAAEFTHLYETYLAHTDHINNWDLVDASAGPVLGGYLLARDRAVLYRLAESPLVWERRIAMVSTQKFIGAGQTADVYRLAELLLDDPHDLMHKAVGWMLREAGKRVDLDELRAFLDQHAQRMPRTMLRYAIERFGPEERQRYLAIKRR
ncbi:MAG: DNA alkylation repair protein [Propionibacteriaceae bacterium]